MNYKEQLQSSIDKILGIKVDSAKDRSCIYKDIPIEALGPEGTALLDNAKLALVDHANKSKIKPLYEKYSIEQKMEAAVIYSLLGSASAAAKEMEIDESTVRNWSHQPWWGKAVKLGKFYKDTQLHSKLINTQEIALDTLTQRIEKGEITTQSLVSALKVIGEEKRETRRDLESSSDKDNNKDALKNIQDELKKLAAFHNAKDVTPRKKRTKEKKDA